MSWVEADLDQAVKDLTQLDPSLLTNETAVFDLAKDSMLTEYSRREPNKLVSVQASADNDTSFDLPVTFIKDFSVVTFVETPDDGLEDSEIPAEEYFVYDNDFVTFQLRLSKGRSIPTGQNIRIVFTATHTLTSFNDFFNEAVAYLMCVHVCQIAAANLTNDQDSTLLADTVEKDEVANLWTDKAEEFRKLYEQALNPQKGEAVTPATVYVNLDSKFAEERRRILHGPRALRNGFLFD